MTFPFQLSPLCATLLLALSSLSLQGCGSDDDAFPPQTLHASNSRAGFVSFDKGVGQAEVQVFDLAANTSNTTFGHTNASGMYLGTPLPLGGNYRIEARNGVFSDGGLINGTLTTEIRNYDGGTIHINPVTTLVSRYLATQPSLSLTEAEEAVRRFLQLPKHQNLGTGLDVNTAEFSYSSFRAAMGDTHFDAFIDSLIAEMTASTDATHPFPPQRMLQLPGAGGLGGYVAEKLVAGALQQVGGQAMGEALASLGLGDNTSGQLAAIQATLREMQAQLTNLEAQTAAIQSELKVAQYNDGVNALSTTITQVKNLTGTLNLLINLSPEDYTAETTSWNKTRSDFYNAVCHIYTNGEFGASADVFDDILRGTQTGTPLITLVGQAKTTGRYLFNYQDSQDLYAVRQYWETIQAQLFNLIDIYLSVGQSNDGCNSTPASTRLVSKPGSALQARREAVARGFDERQRKQVAMYPTLLVPKDTAIDIQNKTMVRTDIPILPRMYYPQANESRYSQSQHSTWNYANLTMNSDQSPMAASPAYLRQGWRLILRHELWHYFGNGNPIAVQYGWPSASTWGDITAVSQDLQYCSVRSFVTRDICGWIPAIRDFNSYVKYDTDGVVTIAVRPLVAEEDYLPK